MQGIPEEPILEEEVVVGTPYKEISGNQQFSTKNAIAILHSNNITDFQLVKNNYLGVKSRLKAPVGDGPSGPTGGYVREGVLDRGVQGGGGAPCTRPAQRENFAF